jgi:hypothetical protein
MWSTKSVSKVVNNIFLRECLVHENRQLNCCLKPRLRLRYGFPSQHYLAQSCATYFCLRIEKYMGWPTVQYLDRRAASTLNFYGSNITKFCINITHIWRYRKCQKQYLPSSNCDPGGPPVLAALVLLREATEQVIHVLFSF